AKFDGNVPALDVARFVQPFSKSRQEGCLALKRTEAEISDHRHRRLLRPRRERPGRRRAAKKRNEIAPPQVEHATIFQWGGPRHPQPAIGEPASPWGRPEMF